MSMELSKNKISELALLKQKKHRRQESKIVLEGQRLLLQLAEYGVFPQELYRLADYEVPSPLAEVADYICDERAMERICDTLQPQGIAGLYGLPKPEFRGFSRAFYLDGISDPGNMGTIFRLAIAFGIDAILLSEDCADPASPKVIRASLGAVYRLPYATLNPMALRLPGLMVIGTDAQAEHSLQEFRPRGRQPLLIVIGGEARGMSEEIKKRCIHHLRIEMSTAMESLNAAVAAGIIAHHLYIVDKLTDII